MKLIRKVVEIQGIDTVHLTTNGVLTEQYIPELKSLGIASINLSLDTLNRERFKMIALRDEFPKVQKTLDALLEHDIPTKINAVVMEGRNIDDIVPLTELTRNHPISVRFIEEMPFNGEGSHYASLKWTYKKIHDYIQSYYPEVTKTEDPPNATASGYKVPGFVGDLGIIAAFSRTFCGSCNRIRVTANGTLKTCLYDSGVLNIRDLVRSNSEQELEKQLMHAFAHRPKDGFEAEQNRINHLPITESMSTIGG
jgi:cyclic pyranopterin phosphate synthase